MTLDTRDWQAMKDAGSNRPLDPDSAEAKQLESSLATLSSANLAQLARAMVRNRIQMYLDLYKPPAA